MSGSKKLPVALLVDDEPSVLETMEFVLGQHFKIVTASSGKEAIEKVANEQINIVFLDIKMPDSDGIDVLRKIREYDENMPVIMATATDNAHTAVQALQSGACDYITKPFNVEEIIIAAKRALERQVLMKGAGNTLLKREKCGFDNIIGNSRKMKELYELVDKISCNDATVLICGESGTGKELIARAIHFNSSRKEKPFIPINCAGIPENLLESELFGYEKGAFTDATSQKLGMFELADEGTLFLDEISGLRLDVQANLLRALEEKEIRRLGGTKLIKVDTRIISATNVDLKQAVQDGKFRQDLYYRLNIVPVYIPPLRSRKEDIPLLVEYFISRYNQILRKKITGVTAEALEFLINYDWPGNVRELKNVIERLVALKDNSAITPNDLPFDMFVKSRLAKKSLPEGWTEGWPEGGPEGGLKEASEDFQKQYIETVLEKTGGNQSRAAKVLGIHRNALLEKMKKLGLKK